MGTSSDKLFKSIPEFELRYCGRHFWSQGNFYITSGELIKEMIKEYLDHRLEPKVVDNFRTEDQTGFLINLKTDNNG